MSVTPDFYGNAKYFKWAKILCFLCLLIPPIGFNYMFFGSVYVETGFGVLHTINRGLYPLWLGTFSICWIVAFGFMFYKLCKLSGSGVSIPVWFVVYAFMLNIPIGIILAVVLSKEK